MGNDAAYRSWLKHLHCFAGNQQSPQRNNGAFDTQQINGLTFPGKARPADSWHDAFNKIPET